MGAWTAEREREFFGQHRADLVRAAEDGGAAGVHAFYETFASEDERRVLAVFSLHALNDFRWPGRDLDLLVRVADLGLAELLRQVDAAEGEEQRGRRILGAHTLGFHLAADLADCWPGDDLEREPRHLRRGLRAATDCIALCPEDREGLLARDHWAKGVHQVALGDRQGAIESWEESVALATRYAEARGHPTKIGKECYFGILLPNGLLGAARMLTGDPEGMQLYLDTMVSFGLQLDDEKAKAAADSAIQQIEKIRARYLEPES